MSVEQREHPVTPCLVQPRTGVRREVAFFGRGPDRLFGCTYLPGEAARAGVLICSPPAAELEKNYRRETLLAEALAGRGLAVQRFHFRGAGHSDGDPLAITFDSMLHDVLEAAAHLSERSDVSTLGFVGTRLGALVAAAAATTRDGAPLVCWEPVLEGRRYFREAFRAVAMRALRQGEGAPAQGPVASLRERGSIDVLGHAVGLPLYETLVERTLAETLAARPREVLLVQLSRDPAVGSAHRDAAARLQGLGLPVETRVIEEAEPWWFGEHRRGRKALTAATSDWLAARLTGTAA
jgi:alpha-beta hydrolase superfamily lysophospholipase